MRREFRLPSFDEAYLNGTKLPWETIAEKSGTRWLLIHNRPVPNGYNVATAITALQVPPGYADAQIDMVYFHPALALTSGRSIGALVTHDIEGVTYQRWSRHRTQESAWRPGDDDVSTHLILVDSWLERELAK